MPIRPLKYTKTAVAVQRLFFFFPLDIFSPVGYDISVNEYYLYKDEERDSSAEGKFPQRVGGGVSPTESLCVKITRELPAEWLATRHGRISPVSGRAYDGTYK